MHSDVDMLNSTTEMSMGGGGGGCACEAGGALKLQPGASVSLTTLRVAFTQALSGCY